MHAAHESPAACIRGVRAPITSAQPGNHGLVHEVRAGEHAGNGVKKVIVGQQGFMATPAMSALIRRRSLYGGLIMSASHNPAGPEEDWGIKFNYSSGEPAPERITDQIFKFTETVSELKMADFPDVDLDTLGTTTFGDFEVEVVSPTEDYFATLKEVRCSAFTREPLTNACMRRRWSAYTHRRDGGATLAGAVGALGIQLCLPTLHGACVERGMPL
jgi:hypothetical protein